jgi:hypothetical protein
VIEKDARASAPNVTGVAAGVHDDEKPSEDGRILDRLARRSAEWGGYFFWNSGVMSLQGCF